jgi:hypothetical protein
MTDDEMVRAQQNGCIVIFCAFVISLLYYERLTQRIDNSALREKRYDMETCTAGDYSVRINLSEEFTASF